MVSYHAGASATAIDMLEAALSSVSLVTVESPSPLCPLCRTSLDSTNAQGYCSDRCSVVAFLSRLRKLWPYTASLSNECWTLESLMLRCPIPGLYDVSICIVCTDVREEMEFGSCCSSECAAALVEMTAKVKRVVGAEPTVDGNGTRQLCVQQEDYLETSYFSLYLYSTDILSWLYLDGSALARLSKTRTL